MSPQSISVRVLFSHDDDVMDKKSCKTLIIHAFMQILYTDSQNTYYRQSGFTLSRYSKCTVTRSVTINTFSKRLSGYQQAWSRRRGVDGGECKGYWGQENDPV